MSELGHWSASQALDACLAPAGLRLHKGSTGMRIVPSLAESPTAAETASERARAFTVLNHADLMLLRRIATMAVKSNAVANRNDGNVSVFKLLNCGLIREADEGALTLTPQAKETLGRA